ncbi:hypothetical protein [Algisphaera agarilytica]|uniref:TRAP-type mannitol/chloroaromatic compound transport system substrate-binding protein n=1 Tax=Algisphaera agarilytica TaxID=1385975 RepID=A0A7X0H6M5_9BACT|nr:hypothetical protein [Algisphaera agarilytica]MBB6430027.1 TRAP-type mannitol/chloroaromatic compound transport system substrate-binding protein [Algisphaera agarilytica]
MKTLRYLNTVLTVIAILLTLNVYIQLTGTPAGAAVSVAQEAHASEKKPVRGVGSSAQAQLDQLKEINENLARLSGKLTDGSVRVKVDSLPAEGD